MKKLILVLMLLVLSMYPLTARAKDSYNYSSANGLVARSNLACFTAEPNPINLNGLQIVSSAPIGGFERRLTPIDKNKYYTDGYNYVGIKGIVLSFTNETNSVAIVSWRDSVISVDGHSYGMPYIAGMPYREAGNPSATPNTIIPPKTVANISIYIPTISFFDGNWYHYPAFVQREETIKLSCYMNVTVNGNISYVSLETPPISLERQSVSIKHVEIQSNLPLISIPVQR